MAQLALLGVLAMSASQKPEGCGKGDVRVRLLLSRCNARGLTGPGCAGLLRTARLAPPRCHAHTHTHTRPVLCIALFVTGARAARPAVQLIWSWRMLKAGASANDDTVKFITERGQVDRYKDLELTKEGDSGATLKMADGTIWDIPGAQDTAVPSNHYANEENKHPTLEELHEKMQAFGFVEKSAEDLAAYHEVEFAKFQKRVHWYYEQAAPEKLKDAAFAAKLERLMRDHSKSRRAESMFMREVRDKYPGHSHREIPDHQEGINHSEL